jgi:transcriptional regulator with AAA-type ATPase domain
MQKNPANDLDSSAIDSLRAYSREVSYSEGHTVVQRGEPGRKFYLVTSGQLEVLLGDEDRRLRLAQLGAGSSFGEMSLLTGAAISADVVTLSQAKVLVFSEDQFQQALAQSAPLRNHILARLSNNLRQTSSEAWDLFQHTQALNSLMLAQGKDGPVVSESFIMNRVSTRIKQLAQESGPILITGEAGTGKFFAAKKIHEATDNQNAPLIIVDCLRIAGNQTCKILFGSDQVNEFPRRSIRSSSSDLQVQGALHLADRGSLILKHINALDPGAQEILALYLETISRDEDIYPQTRVIATSREDIHSLAEKNHYYFPLAEKLTAQTLNMPSLRRRKHDILPLARLFLTTREQQESETDQQEQTTQSYFTKSAEHALLSAQYQHRNAAELREAVELAVVFADGPEVDAEHIFTGPKDKGHPIEYDLGRLGLVQWLAKSSTLRGLQLAVLVFFLSIAFFCLAAGSDLTGRIANTLVWAIWWPGLMIIFLCLGRLWCTVCPISSMGRIVRWFGGFKLAPPDWIKNYTGWIMALLFLAIIWSEQVFHMTETPEATGILLLSLMGFAAFFCVMFQREVWCRYLCPLGSLGASYSVSSTVHVHANPGVCASQCTTHECFKGSDREAGCPMFHHPLYARDAHFCKLCFTCLRSCPHQSANIYLRPPLQDLWRLGDLGTSLVPFALVFFFLPLIMLAAQRFPESATTLGFTVMSFIAVAISVVFYFALPRMLPRNQDPALITRIVFTLLILAWGPFMAVHLANIPELDSIRIYATSESFWASLFSTSELTLLTLLQFMVVFFAALMAALTFGRIRAHFKLAAGPRAFWAWKILPIIVIVYLIVALLLILPRGIIL